ncbi:MAG: hypothetical protein SVY15_04055 [Halobacteriota archaeon]|nr:hypothetical protein [Halobacteriota archaeon]
MVDTQEEASPSFEDLLKQNEKLMAYVQEDKEIRDKRERENQRNVKKDKGSSPSIISKVYVIKHDYTFERAWANISGDTINLINGKMRYQITSQPLKFYSRRTVKTTYFCSDATGTTIDFEKLMQSQDQFDAITRRLWFDKKAFQTAFGSLKPDPMQNILYIVCGVALGFVISIFMGG